MDCSAHLINDFCEDYGYDDSSCYVRSRHRGLSRHGVLHGIDTNYATKINCLKAASFVGFTAWLMAENGSAHPESDDTMTD